jgi:undecaprenyl phosphate-alpha-L-ara4N flippase subunit ArnF
MQPTTLALVLAAVVFSASGQLLLKAGAQRVEAASGVGFLLAALADGRVVLGLAAWAVSTLCWLYVLRTAPLSRAYGLTSLTYVLVLFASVLFLGEGVRRGHVAGTVLIVMGIAFLLYGE